MGGQFIYSDTSIPLSSTDFNTFLYAVIQNDGTTETWRGIFDITFNSIGIGGNPNNTLTIKAHPSYDSKTLTDLNNDFVNSLTLFKTENILNQVMDIIYGTVSSTIGKSLKQLEKEAQIYTVVEKMVNNVNTNQLNDSQFKFTNAETLAHQQTASARKSGLAVITTSASVTSSVPASTLTNFNADFALATSSSQKRSTLGAHLDIMANASVANITNPIDVATGKSNFIKQIILSLVKSFVNVILSPKVIFIFLINYLIVYGPTATYDDPIDFIKKNKRLMNAIIIAISEAIVKVLLGIALKEIGTLVAQAIAKKEQEKGALTLAQLESLIGIPSNLVNNLLQSLI